MMHVEEDQRDKLVLFFVVTFGGKSYAKNGDAVNTLKLR